MTARVLTLLLVLMAPLAIAADVDAGRDLHRDNCVACHQSLMNGDAALIYTRSDRKITSFPSLLAQVRRCEVNLGLQWFDEDVENVAAFLNASYYRF